VTDSVTEADGGVAVLPITSLGLNHTASDERVSTGCRASMRCWAEADTTAAAASLCPAWIRRLPVLKEAPQGPRAEITRQDAANRVSRRVLIVEDNADAAASLALLLSLQGHEIRTASDGPTALQLAESFRPEVVLLDIGLPGGLSVREVAKRFRQKGSQKTVLVAMTGFGQEADQSAPRKRESTTTSSSRWISASWMSY
jgi:two-component system, OmpR family, response regulator